MIGSLLAMIKDSVYLFEFRVVSIVYIGTFQVYIYKGLKRSLARTIYYFTIAYFNEDYDSNNKGAFVKHTPLCCLSSRADPIRWEMILRLVKFLLAFTVSAAVVVISLYGPD